MIKLYVVTSDGFDVYYNQALEKYLLDQVKRDEIILFLWQNDRTVVIGKNQDAYGECRTETLIHDGGFLARRLSGGGAVYHDRGNLNFTFICRKDLYDPDRQDQIVLDALKHLGIHAEKNGRNDLVIEGKKFSGHAYYKGKEGCFHHGTIMLEVNEKALEKYLNVSPLKLHSKAVRSVRSRVANLKRIRQDLDLDMLKKGLILSFEDMYGCRSTDYPLDEKKISAGRKFFADKEWIYGPEIHLNQCRQARFDWGTVRVIYDLKDGRIADLKIYTDALDQDLSEELEKKLRGRELSEAVFSDSKVKDIINLLKEGNHEI
ncbi:MAG: lipoate--protein ligase [Erysipelotrichaceae bacterium]|nr:lipoate--protein ligase [Erysipelotrichaceae bacterium]